MFAAVLFMASLVPPPPPADVIRQGVELSIKGDYEASDLILRNVKIADPALDFYRLVNAFKLNRKQDVEKSASVILDGFGVDYPQRYLDLALIMQADASTWKDDSDDLADISREMDKITDRLKNSRGGPKTQQIQREVLARLDKMIKDAEDKQKAAQEAAEKAEADADARRAREGRDPIPAPDTIKGQEQGSGQIDPQRRVREIAEVWGKLPEKQRAKAMVELLRRLPANDRAVIERYFKELQKKSGR